MAITLVIFVIFAVVQFATISRLSAKNDSLTEHNAFLQSFINSAVETVTKREIEEAEAAYEKGWKARVQ